MAEDFKQIAAQSDPRHKVLSNIPSAAQPLDISGESAEFILPPTTIGIQPVGGAGVVVCQFRGNPGVWVTIEITRRDVFWGAFSKIRKAGTSVQGNNFTILTA